MTKRRSGGRGVRRAGRGARRTSTRKVWLGVLVLAGGGALWALEQRGDSPASGDAAIVDAFERRRSGQMVEAAGTVDRTLPDDTRGSRHQRFIVRLASGHTLLISHNIDLAPRVPLKTGDRVSFRGEYEWNERGGVVHWTHDDPGARRPGGWIEYAGERYR